MFSDRYVHYFTDTDSICIFEVVDKSVTEHAECKLNDGTSPQVSALN